MNRLWPLATAALQRLRLLPLDDIPSMTPLDRPRLLLESSDVEGSEPPPGGCADTLLAEAPPLPRNPSVEEHAGKPVRAAPEWSRVPGLFSTPGLAPSASDVAPGGGNQLWNPVTRLGTRAGEQHAPVFQVLGVSYLKADGVLLHLIPSISPRRGVPVRHMR